MFVVSEREWIRKAAKRKRPMWSKTRNPKRLEALAHRMSHAVSADIFNGIKTFRRKIPNKDVIYDAWIKGGYSEIDRAIPWHELPDSLMPYQNTLMSNLGGISKLGLDALPAPAKEYRFDYENPRIQRIFEKRAAQRIVSISDDSRKSIQGIVHTQFTQGRSPRDLAGEIKNHIGLYPRLAQAHVNYVDGLKAQGLPEAKVNALSEANYDRLLDYRAMSIARTESSYMLNRGQLEVWKQSQDDGMIPQSAMKVWQVDSDPCDLCEPMDGIGVLIDDFWTLSDGTVCDVPTDSHTNCWIAGHMITTINGPKPIEEVELGELVLTHKMRWRKVTHLFKTPHSGEVFQFGIDGKRLVCTPNHPFLVGEDRWEEAVNLSVGQQAFKVNDILGSQVMVENVKNSPTVFGKIPKLFSVGSDFLFGLMPITAVNLNGQTSFRNGDINVERTNWKKGLNFYPVLFKKLNELLLKFGEASGFEYSESSTFKEGRTLLRPSNSFVSCSAKILSVFRSCLFEPLSLGLSHVPRLNIRFFKPFVYRTSGNTQNRSNFKDGHTLVEMVDNGLNRNIGSSSGHKVPFEIQPTVIDSKSKLQFEGFVYNLEVEEDHSYVCEGVVVHNCLCIMTIEYGEEDNGQETSE